jgi:hypothetical protein
MKVLEVLTVTAVVAGSLVTVVFTIPVGIGLGLWSLRPLPRAGGKEVAITLARLRAADRAAARSAAYAAEEAVCDVCVFARAPAPRAAGGLMQIVAGPRTVACARHAWPVERYAPTPRTFDAADAQARLVDRAGAARTRERDVAFNVATLPLFLAWGRGDPPPPPGLYDAHLHFRSSIPEDWASVAAEPTTAPEVVARFAAHY